MKGIEMELARALHQRVSSVAEKGNVSRIEEMLRKLSTNPAAQMP